MVLGSMLSFTLRAQACFGTLHYSSHIQFLDLLEPCSLQFRTSSSIYGSCDRVLGPIIDSKSVVGWGTIARLYDDYKFIGKLARSYGSTKIWDSQFQWYRYEDGHQTIWNIQDDCVRDNGLRGFIPSCPVPDLQSLRLFTGSSATPSDGNTRKHSKLDNPAWQYIDHSYGVGSSVGLADDSFSLRQVGAYNYTETGYEVNVQCIKNSSSRFSIQHASPGPGWLQIYNAHGWLPNMFANEDFKVELNDVYGYNKSYPSFLLYDDYRDMAAWTAHTSDSGNMIGVTTSKKGRYTELNQTQCDVHVAPASFKVSAKYTERSIKAKQSGQAPYDPDPTGRLQWVVMNSINLLARMSPSLYVSVLGDALEPSVNAMTSRNPDFSEEEATTSGIAEAFSAMIDDILVAYGASQLVHAKDSTSMAATTHSATVQIGKSATYLYLATTVHAIVVFIWFLRPCGYVADANFQISTI